MSCNMLVQALLASLVMGVGTEPSNPSDRETYDKIVANASKGADAQVRLALWCEAHGLGAERLKHLMRAVLADPAHPLARGLLGMVSYKGKWIRPEEAAAVDAEDPRGEPAMREYLERRARAKETAEEQGRLARWCEEKGLKEQATAHYRAVVRLDPGRESAWKRLGYRKVGGRWFRPEELAAAKTLAQQQRAANAYWKPRIEKIRDELASKDPHRRVRAARGACEITDAGAVPMIWQMLMPGSEEAKRLAIQILSQIDSPAATRAIASIAVMHPSPEMRGMAAKSLSRRDPRDFLSDLLAMIHAPFKYRVKPIDAPGSEGVLYAEGEEYNIKRSYRTSPIDLSNSPPRLFSDDVPFNPFSLPNMLIAGGWGAASTSTPQPATARQIPSNPTTPGQAASAIRQAANQADASGTGNGAIAALAYSTWATAVRRDMMLAEDIAAQESAVQQARMDLQSDMRELEASNSEISALNDRVLPVAREVLGRDFGTDRNAWTKWWANEQGYVQSTRETQPKPEYASVQVYSPTPRSHSACFVAGTPVHTHSGRRPIEDVQVGDLVLSQDTTTGALSYQPVVAVHHNRPSATLKLRLGGETVIATGIHRFWKVGTGWTMARDLKKGDEIRAIGGIAKVEEIEPGTTVPVFNLDVARHTDFFVGRRGFLVYDFSVVRPVNAPFDRSSVEAASSSKTPQ